MVLPRCKESSRSLSHLMMSFLFFSWSGVAVRLHHVEGLTYYYFHFQLQSILYNHEEATSAGTEIP